MLRFAPDGRMQVVICERASEGLWALPKGRPRAGEGREPTALREVMEETGLKPSIAAHVKTINYSFAHPPPRDDAGADDGADRERTVYDKTVFFYLMTAEGGSLADHDGEYDNVFWVNVDEALARMTHAEEAEVVRRAAALFGGKNGV